jgi:hypothetical protein
LSTEALAKVEIILFNELPTFPINRDALTN